MKTIKFFLFVLTCFSGFAVQAQDSLKLMVETMGAASVIDKALPHWMAFNRYGFLPTGESSAYSRLEIKRPFSIGENFKVSTEFDGIANTSDVFIHEAYVNLQWKNWSLQMGLNEINNQYFPDDLSTGHMFASRNARTIPKVTLGVLEYSDVPWTKGYLQYRGALSQGILESDRPVSNALYHEKYASIRTRKLPINFHIGFMHNALFGGEFNGEKQSTKYLEVFLGQRSSTSNVNGDSINAAGAHFGIFDYGLSLETTEADFDFYYHQPWTDGSSIKDWSASNKDYMLGIRVRLKNQQWLTEILYENINTIHQSGPGLPDPIINDVGYNFGELQAIENYDQFIIDELGQDALDRNPPQGDNLTFDEFLDIIRFETNNNLEYGGRDSYYNNRGFPRGNTYQGFTIGNPLFLTSDRLFELNGIRAFDAEFIVNNRIQAQHIGFKGKIVPLDLDYKMLITFTRNEGTYAGFYGGFIGSWNRDRTYFFRNGINAQYLYLELKKDMEKLPLTWTGAVGFDQRGFGNFLAFMGGLQYRIR
ncbi:MAG: capsule assembly Wzi family protein [Cytophagales bacterium]|nr:capsule assembly Wzi family protein [Cytophagales bacterium]